MTMWAVIRDDKFFEGYATRARAQHAASFYRPGSKHKWRVVKIIIEAWHEAGQ